MENGLNAYLSSAVGARAIPVMGIPNLSIFTIRSSAAGADPRNGVLVIRHAFRESSIVSRTLPVHPCKLAFAIPGS